MAHVADLCCEGINKLFFVCQFLSVLMGSFTVCPKVDGRCVTGIAGWE